MRNLINIITEAEVKPGERKNISFKVNRLEKMLKKLNAYKKNAELMTGMDLPDSAKEDLSALLDKVNTEIAKVQQSYDEAKAKTDSSTDTPIKVTNFFNGLMKNCKQILAVYKMMNKDLDTKKTNDMRFLFRGIKGQASDALYGKPFLDRKPKDSPQAADMLFNLAMKEAGFDARRDNSSFVSGNDSHAGGYGNLYIMFPVDGFKFTWSKKHDDLVLPDNFTKANMLDKTKVTKLKNAIDKLDKETLHTLKWKYDLYNQGAWGADTTLHNIIGLKKAISNGALPEDFSALLDSIFNIAAVKKSIDSYQLSGTDLASAILSNHEIYVSGPYYAIKDTAANRKRLVEFLNSSALSDEDAPEATGKLGTRHSPGTVVRIPQTGALGTVLKWTGSTTDVSVSTVKGDKTISVPSDELEIVDANVDQYPRADDIVLIKSTGKIGKVTGSYGPADINVQVGNSWGADHHKKHNLEKIDTSSFSYAPGDKVIIIKPNNYYETMYGKIGVIKKALKKKVTLNTLTKTGKVSKSEYEMPTTYVVPLNSEIAQKLFPKIATSAPATKESDVYADILAALQPKIKSGLVTYADIDHVAQNLDYDPDKLIAMIQQQGVEVKPLDIPGNT